ncbi:MAG: nucleotide exchange factor GrpE [Candidatus Uhrbacteria bacterium]
MSDEQDVTVEPTVETPVEDKAAEYLAGWKRALADYDNLKKEQGRERVEMRAAATADAASRIIPVIDNFDTAVKFVPEGIDAKLKNWLMGILFVQTQLDEVLLQMGVEPFGEVGDPFDANLHDAVGERADEKVAANAIVEVVARGWKLGSKVIRPAKVIVQAS